MLAFPGLTVATRSRGAAGTMDMGVAVTDGELCPVPNAFTARIRTRYVVPFLSPEMTMGDAVVGEVARRHVDPLSIEYSYPVIPEPPSDIGGWKVTRS
jgi:hypothetical protein